MIDVVYILKNHIIPTQELIYSLRSLVNFPYRKVWFAGGKPDDIEPDEYLKVNQKGNTKWEKTTYTVRKVCECDEITKSFWLFNDDFFILKKVEYLPPIYNGDLKQRLKTIGQSLYSVKLQETLAELQRRDLGIKNYAVHIPMLINKKKALEVLEEFEGNPMFRCLYGNYWKIGGADMLDVKIRTNGETFPEDAQFVSTSDVTFKWGEAGRMIRTKFQEPSRFEVL